MTIAVIEDDKAILRSLGMLLESRGLSVRCYASAESFLDNFTTETPSCVVSDIRMPGLSGLELQQELRKRDSAVPVILITGHGDIAMAVKAVKEGAFDFIEKPFDEERLVASIAAAIESGARQRVKQSELAHLATRASELSPRQLEVMRLVAEGFSNKEIAIKLDISPRTVENYRAWVMEKMGATNLADLVRKALILQNTPS
jgi:two-component system, LuxR family, response regulator FixJ